MEAGESHIGEHAQQPRGQGRWAASSPLLSTAVWPEPRCPGAPLENEPDFISLRVFRENRELWSAWTHSISISKWEWLKEVNGWPRLPSKHGPGWLVRVLSSEHWHQLNMGNRVDFKFPTWKANTKVTSHCHPWYLQGLAVTNTTGKCRGREDFFSQYLLHLLASVLLQHWAGTMMCQLQGRHC